MLPSGTSTSPNADEDGRLSALLFKLAQWFEKLRLRPLFLIELDNKSLIVPP